jgi:hypothetical protein
VRNSGLMELSSPLFIALCLAVLPGAAAAKEDQGSKACLPPLSAEVAARELDEAKGWIKRAGEHPRQDDLAQILPRLRRAAYAGNHEAQLRFGNYVVGYYFTDEMFWPSEPDVAIPALAMLRIAAQAEPNSPSPLIKALARDPIVFADSDGLPALPKAWIAAALREAKRYTACARKRTNNWQPPRQLTVPAVERLLAPVKVGWTAKRVVGRAGEPTKRLKDHWLYVGGSPEGPETTFDLTVRNGIVTAIKESSVSCRR